MIRLIGIELLKVRTTRTGFGLLAGEVALTALDAILRASRAGSGKLAPLNTAAGLTNVLTLTGFALLMAALLGATMSSGEFRHATATLTYLAYPNRTQVLIAKTLAAAIAGLAFGVIGAAISTGVGLTFVAAHGYPVALAANTITGYALGAVLGAALLAAVGAALGSLIRSQLAVVVGILVWALFVESIVGGLFNSLGPYLPFTAATTLAGAKLGGGGFGYTGSSAATALPFAAATALVIAATVLIATVAARTTVTADIS